MAELSNSILDDIRDAEGGWCTSFLHCDLCGHEWVGVHPVETEVSECQCPHCGQQGYAELAEI